MRQFLFLLFLLFWPLSVSALSAESYAVMDYDSGRILDGSNLDKEKLIASTTKIMTAIIALENADINKTIVVGEEVLRAYGSAIYIEMDEEISLKDLLYGLMLRSGNDAAIEIAYLVSDGMQNFVNLMNQKAYELGMSHTSFVNNHGLEENDDSANISTARDMATLMRYALSNETFREIIGTKSYTTKTNHKSYVWQNKNKLLKTYPYNIGGKTGFTEKARRTLVTASSRDDKTCIVVTLNDGNDFENHKNLCESVFQNYERVPLILKDRLEIDGNTDGKYYVKDDLYALLKKDEISHIRIDYQIKSDSSEEEVGVAQVFLDDELLSYCKIYQKVEKQTEQKEGFFKRFLRWLFGW